MTSEGQSQEESLSTGIDRHLTQFNHLQAACGDLGRQATRFKEQCNALKAERDGLRSEVVKLNDERSQLVSERDTLRLECQSKAQLNEWFLQRDLSAANTAASTARAGAAASGSSNVPGSVRLADTDSAWRDEKGKLVRRLHLSKTRCEDIERELDATRCEAEEAIVAEQYIAQGLRDRIGTLESTLRERDAEIAARTLVEKLLQQQVKSVEESLGLDLATLQTERDDAVDALRREKADRKRLEGENESLKARLEAALDQARIPAAVPVAEKCMSSALQEISVNVAQPVTPSKPRSLTPLRSPQASKTPGSPHSHLAKKFAYLMEKYSALRAEYDTLRERYEKDLAYWKEYKAVEMARSQRKKIKKEEKLRLRNTPHTPAPAATVQASSSRSSDASGTTVKPAEVSGDRRPEDEQRSVPQVLVPESESVGPKRQTSGLAPGRTLSLLMDKIDSRSSQLAEAAKHLVPSQESEDMEVELEYISPEPSQTNKQAVSSPVKPIIDDEHMSSERLHGTGADPVSHPKDLDKRDQGLDAAAGPDPEEPNPGAATPLGPKLSIAGLRTTPWLDSTTKQKVPLGSKRAFPGDYDPFESDEHSAGPSSTSAAPVTPLVRDRGGMSLRKAALQHSVAGQQAAAIGPDSPSATGEPQTPAAAMLKRKLSELDGMSPADRSRELKRINALPASVKRQVYADYKGKGRYLPPDQVQLTEFEIDPKRNEGVKHAFDEVKRGREQRRAMHGGDCECCRDYYEGIGPIPRFNQGPKWKDTDDADSAAEQDYVRAHQNQTSRHREVWERPPTPPGFWSTGFPTTQQVQEQNRAAERMNAEKEARIRREAAKRDGKWRKKD